jgi:ribonuclease R
LLNAKNGQYAAELSTLDTIAKKLREEKIRQGAIDFEQDEVKIELDQNFKPIRIVKKQRLDTHKLVEEYMLLANKEVAEYMWRANAKKKGVNQPFIYRIHDLPDREKIAGLALFVKALGYHLPTKDGRVTSKDMQTLLNKLEGKSEESIIKTAAVRSMAKAIYSTGNIGHFGLAFEFYTHFTSPIRRYADLLVHRLLFKHLRGEQVPPHEYAHYQKLAMDTSEKEVSAAEAERNSKKYKQVEYMQERIGQEFDGIVTGVTEWGMYVEEANTRCEGMIKLRDLGDDYYILDEKNYALVGEKTKRRFSIGDKIRIKVASADIERKALDYVLAQ